MQNMLNFSRAIKRGSFVMMQNRLTGHLYNQWADVDAVVGVRRVVKWTNALFTSNKMVVNGRAVAVTDRDVRFRLAFARHTAGQQRPFNSNDARRTVCRFTSDTVSFFRVYIVQVETRLSEQHLQVADPLWFRSRATRRRTDSSTISHLFLVCENCSLSTWKFQDSCRWSAWRFRPETDLSNFLRCWRGIALVSSDRRSFDTTKLILSIWHYQIGSLKVLRENSIWAIYWQKALWIAIAVECSAKAFTIMAMPWLEFQSGMAKRCDGETVKLWNNEKSHFSETLKS